MYICIYIYTLYTYVDIYIYRYIHMVHIYIHIHMYTKFRGHYCKKALLSMKYTCIRRNLFPCRSLLSEM